MAIKNYAYINSEMLRWARGETPFVTAEEAASYLNGITAEKLTAGRRAQTIHLLMKQKN